MLNAGDLNKRVTIQRLAESHADGEVTYSPVDLATVWAEVKPLTGREYYQAAQVHAEITHRVRIRWRSGISGKLQIKLGNRLLEVLGPPRNIGEGNVELEMLCKEKDPQ